MVLLRIWIKRNILLKNHIISAVFVCIVGVTLAQATHAIKTLHQVFVREIDTYVTTSEFHLIEFYATAGRIFSTCPARKQYKKGNIPYRRTF